MTASAGRRREGWLALAFVVLGEISLFHRMLWSGLRETAGDYVNHLLGSFVLEHSYLWLTGRPDHAALWDPPVYWPVRNVLVYAETLLGAAPLYWPWRLLGFAPDTAYQLWMMTLPVLGFAAAWLLFRSGFGFPALPAAMGSYLCAFGRSLESQVNNPQLHTLFYSYLALYCLCRLFRSPAKTQPGWTVAFFACLAAQLYACVYLGWLLVFFLGLATLVMIAMPGLRPLFIRVATSNLIPGLAGALGAALVLFPLVTHSLQIVRSLGWSNETGAKPMMPHLLSWVYMGRRSLAYFWFSRTELFAHLPGEPEERLGLGFVTLACAALGLWQLRKSPWMRLLAVLTLALVLLPTELPGGFSLWYGVRALVPGARALRIVARIGVLLIVPAGIGLAAFTAARRRTPAVLALLAVCLAEQAYSENTFSKVNARAAADGFAAAVDRRCPSFYMAITPTRGTGAPHWVYGVEILMAQLRTGIPAVNGGYTRFQPPGYGSLDRNVILTPADGVRLRRDLAAWRTRNGLEEGDVCWIEVADPR
jgi:hypothetical protein